jgi:hypothetical protein
MTPIERLNEILKQLKTLEDETSPVYYGRAQSATAILTALATFTDNLSDTVQQLETAIIELENEEVESWRNEED